MSDSEGSVPLPDEDEDNDLFGDGDIDEDIGVDNDRVVDDDDDDDEAPRRRDADGDGYGADDVEMDEQQVKNVVIVNTTIYRHRTPKTKDGAITSLRPPKFLKWNPEEYKPDEFEPSAWDQENAKAEQPKGVIRWMRDPKSGDMKSNTNIYRWSDGSVTIQVGNEHYEVSKKQMAPGGDKPYQELQDSHTYAAAAHLSSNILVTVGHIGEQYTVIPNRNVKDEAMIAFANRMAAAQRSSRGGMIITATRDPELQKKEAELAEKELMKAQRRKENAAMRMDRGPGYRSGGLSIGDLEGGRRAPGGPRKRGAPGASRPKKRRPEYDSDDDLPSGIRRQDEYDREDDFIAPSDDDDMGEEAEDDDDDDLLDDDEDEAPSRSKRQKTADAEDEDADGDLDDEDAPAAASKGRRRHIIDDDED